MGGKAKRVKSYRLHASAPSSSTKKKKNEKTDLQKSIDEVMDVDSNNAESKPLSKAVSTEEEEDQENEMKQPEGDEKLSRGQRKRRKKHEMYLKKMGMVQRSLSAKKKEEELKKDFNLSSLSESLFTNISQNNVQHKSIIGSQKISAKARKHLAIREVGQLKAVHSHPAFKDNPFAAIQQHLKNMHEQNQKSG